MITNKSGLPDPIVRFVIESEAKHKTEPNAYSVTELLKPVREIVLSRKHADEIDEDVADMIPAILGTGVHKVLEGYAKGEDRAEFEVEYAIGEIIIHGEIDLLRRNDDTATIYDWKTCSVSKISKQDFDDWRKQTLMYAWLLLMRHCIRVKKVEIIAIMKDWSKVKAASQATYPQSAVFTYEFKVEDSSIDYIDGWIRDRIDAIKAAETELPECTDEEKWRSPDKYAVYKREGDKRALAVYDTIDEAETAKQAKCGPLGHIEKREGDCLKCRLYCKCSKFCKEGK